jgi:hypothetical protein|nr:MAG TPA: protein of unknown function (DUF2102) [Caudoviricetes sp.]
MTKRRVNITTIDNPFDPFDDFYNWFDYDVEKGYYTCQLLARFAKTNDLMTDQEEEEAIEEAIDRIIEFDPLNIYIKVEK